MSLVEIKSTHNPFRYTLAVEPRISVGPPGKQFLFGGAGMAELDASRSRRFQGHQAADRVVP